MNASGLRVALLSSCPQAHAGLVERLRTSGCKVRVRDGAEPQALLRWHPSVILVDLVHGAGLSRESVAALNERPGTSLVVGLHEGRLEDSPHEATGLRVEGFCTTGDWRPLLGVLPESGGERASVMH